MFETAKQNIDPDLSRFAEEIKLKLQLLANYSNGDETSLCLAAEYIAQIGDSFGPATKKAWQNDKIRLDLSWFTELSISVRTKTGKRLTLGETRDNGIGIIKSVVGEVSSSECFSGQLLYWDELRNCVILQHRTENLYESDWVLLKSSDGQPDFEIIDIQPKDDQTLTNTTNSDKILYMKNGEGFIDSKTSLKNALAVCDFANRALDDSNKADDPVVKQQLLNRAQSYLDIANDFESETDIDELNKLSYSGLVTKAISLFKTDQIERSDTFIHTAEIASFGSEDSHGDGAIEALPDPLEAYDIAEKYLEMADDSAKDYQARIGYADMAEVWINIFNDLKTKTRINAEKYLDKAVTSTEDIKTRVDYTLKADELLDKSEVVGKRELKSGLANRFKRIGRLALKVLKPKV